MRGCGVVSYLYICVKELLGVKDQWIHYFATDGILSLGPSAPLPNKFREAMTFVF